MHKERGTMLSYGFNFDIICHNKRRKSTRKERRCDDVLSKDSGTWRSWIRIFAFRNWHQVRRAQIIVRQPNCDRAQQRWFKRRGEHPMGGNSFCHAGRQENNYQASVNNIFQTPSNNSIRSGREKNLMAKNSSEAKQIVDLVQNYKVAWKNVTFGMIRGIFPFLLQLTIIIALF